MSTGSSSRSRLRPRRLRRRFAGSSSSSFTGSVRTFPSSICGSVLFGIFLGRRLRPPLVAAARRVSSPAIGRSPIALAPIGTAASTGLRPDCRRRNRMRCLGCSRLLRRALRRCSHPTGCSRPGAPPAPAAGQLEDHGDQVVLLRPTRRTATEGGDDRLQLTAILLLKVGAADHGIVHCETLRVLGSICCSDFGRCEIEDRRRSTAPRLDFADLGL